VTFGRAQIKIIGHTHKGGMLGHAVWLQLRGILQFCPTNSSSALKSHTFSLKLALLLSGAFLGKNFSGWSNLQFSVPTGFEKKLVGVGARGTTAATSNHEPRIHCFLVFRCVSFRSR